MARLTEWLNDGYYSLEGGMNSGLAPSLLPDNQTSMSVNTTCREGFIKNRPRFKHITLDWQGDDDARYWFETHSISGETYFQPASGAALICCCSGGRFFAAEMIGDTAKVREFTPPEVLYYTRNDQNQQITWFCQAANYLIAQDGTNLPVIFDGSASFRSDPTKNGVPVGRQMAYINNRLFVVSIDGRQIYPGDLAYSTATSVITFTEILLPATEGGQPLGIPLELGGIKGLAVSAQLDTQAGQGTLLVATDRAVTSINPVTQRSQWPNIQLQNIALVGNGFTSNGLAIVNGDVWGRSVDGFRSFIMARRDFATWGNTPQSREVQRILAYDDLALLEHFDAVYFDNRLLMTVNPQLGIEARGAYHNGIVALNFDNISSLTTKSPPAYDGLWTGIKPYGFATGSVNGQQRCFSFCYFPNGNQLYEICSDYGDDLDCTGTKNRIQSFFESRSFSFKGLIAMKQLQAAEFYVDQLTGEVDFELQYKPNQYPCWTPWKSWEECGGGPICSPVGLIDGICVTPTFSALQYRSRMVIGKPPSNVCDPITKNTLDTAFEFSIRLQWTGNVRIRGCVLFAAPRDVNTYLTGCV